MQKFLEQHNNASIGTLMHYYMYKMRILKGKLERGCYEKYLYDKSQILTYIDLDEEEIHKDVSKMLYDEQYKRIFSVKDSLIYMMVTLKSIAILKKEFLGFYQNDTAF